MIKIEYIEIIGNGKTINYYLNKGYDIKCHQKVLVKIEDLIPTSAIKVDCYCDICGCLNNIKYYNYTENIKRNVIYRCNECSKKIRTEKIKDIFSDNEIKKEIVSKRKNTCLLKYGYDSYTKTKDYSVKSGNTKFIKYGDENYNNISKTQNTCLSKYGVDSFSKTELYKTKYKYTCNLKYGVDNVFQDEQIKQKIKETLISKYGVDNPTKHPDLFEKAQRSSYKIIKHNELDIKYQGTYELDFINFCIERDIKFEKGPTIDYTLNEVNRKYHSDFYIPCLNLICEIKSIWTYNKDLEENLAKKEFSEKSGYNFIFLIDKNYNYLEKLLFLWKIKDVL